MWGAGSYKLGGFSGELTTPAEDLFLPIRYCCFVALFIPVSHSDLQTLIKSYSPALMYVSVVSLRDVWNIHDKIGGIQGLPPHKLKNIKETQSYLRLSASENLSIFSPLFIYFFTDKMSAMFVYRILVIVPFLNRNDCSFLSHSYCILVLCIS